MNTTKYNPNEYIKVVGTRGNSSVPAASSTNMTAAVAQLSSDKPGRLTPGIILEVRVSLSPFMSTTTLPFHKKKTPPCSNHLPPGYLRRGIQDHRVDHELPGKPERSNSFQVLRIPQASQRHPGGPLHSRRRCVPCFGQSPRPLPWDEPIGEPRCLQLLPVPVQDGHRTDVRYSGEVYSLSWLFITADVL